MASSAARLTSGEGHAKPARMLWPLFSVAVGMASLSTIALELMLTRVLSVTMYYHFAFMVISIAMLGLSISGVTIYLLPRVFRDRRAPLLCSGFMLLFSLLSLWTVKSALENPIGLHNWRDNLGRLGALYLSSALTMLASGFCISLAIQAARERIGQVYASDLLGAALGCVIVIPIVSAFTGPGALIAAAGVGALAAALFALSAGSNASSTARFALGGLGIAAALGLFVLAAGEKDAQRFGPARNPEKFLGRREVIFEQWNSFSQITVGLSGEPDHHWMFIDADAATRIWSGAIAKDGYRAPRRFGEVRVAALVYALRHERTALIIGPGGGTDVISALHHGVPKVVGVEVNPIIVDDVMKGEFGAYSGDLYRDPRVEVVADEGRSYIRRSEERYGSIQATLVDTWAASSSGAFTLSENNIYTVEAFSEFLDRLAPGGIVAVTRWYNERQPKEFLRLVSIARAALEQRGVAPSDTYKHFVLATDGERRATLLLNRDAFSAADVEVLADKAAEARLRLLFAPLEPQRSRHVVGEDRFLAEFLRAASAQDFLDQLPYDASAVTDDKPFYFYNLRPADLLAIIGDLGAFEINNLGVAILLALLIGSALLTVLLVLLPLLIFERKALRSDRTCKLQVLGFFLSIGLGFILVEIGFMQTFVLFLGHPIYALAVVLASLLAASGFGSALSGRGAARFGLAGSVRRAILALAAVLLLYAFALTPLFRALLGAPLWLRIVLSVLLVFAPGLLMGTLLPSAVRAANRLGAGTVAWGWGLNGAASVVGSILAMALSMNVGFTFALLCGIAVYTAGLLLFPSQSPAPADAATSPVAGDAALAAGP
jgi:spermidine synthase